METEIYNLHIQAGLKCGIEKTCGKKTSFEDEATALKAAANHNKWKDRRHDVEPYPCAFCNRWHIGNIMPVQLLRDIAK